MSDFLNLLKLQIKLHTKNKKKKAETIKKYIRILRTKIDPVTNKKYSDNCIARVICHIFLLSPAGIENYMKTHRKTH